MVVSTHLSHPVPDLTIVQIVTHFLDCRANVRAGLLLGEVAVDQCPHAVFCPIGPFLFDRSPASTTTPVGHVRVNVTGGCAEITSPDALVRKRREGVCKVRKKPSTKATRVGDVELLSTEFSVSASSASATVSAVRKSDSEVRPMQPLTVIVAKNQIDAVECPYGRSYKGIEDEVGDAAGTRPACRVDGHDQWRDHWGRTGSDEERIWVNGSRKDATQVWRKSRRK